MNDYPQDELAITWMSHDYECNYENRQNREQEKDIKRPLSRCKFKKQNHHSTHRQSNQPSPWYTIKTCRIPPVKELEYSTLINSSTEKATMQFQTLASLYVQTQRDVQNNRNPALRQLTSKRNLQSFRHCFSFLAVCQGPRHPLCPWQRRRLVLNGCLPPGSQRHLRLDL